MLSTANLSSLKRLARKPSRKRGSCMGIKRNLDNSQQAVIGDGQGDDEIPQGWSFRQIAHRGHIYGRWNHLRLVHL